MVKAVNGVDLIIYRNRTLCVLGESGCGKSILARSILRIVDAPGRITDGSIVYRAADGRTVIWQPPGMGLASCERSGQ